MLITPRCLGILLCILHSPVLQQKSPSVSALPHWPPNTSFAVYSVLGPCEATVINKGCVHSWHQHWVQKSPELKIVIDREDVSG